MVSCIEVLCSPDRESAKIASLLSLPGVSNSLLLTVAEGSTKGSSCKTAKSPWPLQIANTIFAPPEDLEGSRFIQRGDGVESNTKGAGLPGHRTLLHPVQWSKITHSDQ